MTSDPGGPVAAEPGLVAVGLSRAFGDEVAVQDVDLEVGPGQVHALVGLNGAGKTTLMRLLLGMLRPDSGTARILGRTLTDHDPSLWRGVGHMIEMPFNYPELTARENVRVSARLHGMSRQDAGPAVEAVVDRLAFRRWADRRTATLSLGNRQRVGLACAMVHRPRLLVLDEPTNALDPSGVVLVRDLLTELAEQEGTAVLVSSHHLDEVARVAHRISVLHRGRVVGTLDPDGIDLERQFFRLVHGVDERLGLIGADGGGAS